MMDQLDYNNPDIQEETNGNSDVQPFRITELRDLGEKELGVCYVSDSLVPRCQSYEMIIPGLKKSVFVRQEGFDFQIDLRKYCFMNVVDENGKPLTLGLLPQMIWDKSGYWLTTDLIDWAKTNEPQIIDIVLYALKEIFDFLGFSYIETSTKFGISSLSNDLCYVMSPNNLPQLLIQANKETLDEIEFKLRHYSTHYHKNCLWLGSKVNFPLDCYLLAFKSLFSVKEISALQIGDLIRLQQRESPKNMVLLNARVLCKGLQSKNWVQNVFLKITNEGFEMEFDDDEWQLEDGNPDLDGLNDYSQQGADFKLAEQGPDAIHLDLHIGSTTLSFNELCNVQQGSLIELKNSTLPIVLIKIGNETILEGELVRLKDQLMVQVIRKVE